jgi:prolipoprotein diacylglyceryltransferase
VTDLPWGIDLWGATRHPVQLYLALSALIVVVIVLIYSPSKNPMPGNTFLLFSVTTFSYLIFFAHFQEPGLLMISGFRIEQIVYWLLLLAGLLLLNFRAVSSPTKE